MQKEGPAVQKKVSLNKYNLGTRRSSLPEATLVISAAGNNDNFCPKRALNITNMDKQLLISQIVAFLSR